MPAPLCPAIIELVSMHAARLETVGLAVCVPVFDVVHEVMGL